MFTSMKMSGAGLPLGTSAATTRFPRDSLRQNRGNASPRRFIHKGNTSTHAQENRIREWLWEPTGSSLEYI